MYLTKHHLSRIFILAVVPLLALISCVPLLTMSSHLLAATYSHNPYGGADACAYVNGRTVLYGWAYDADTSSGPNPYVNVSAGSLSAKVGSSVTGYRDSAVLSYVRAHNPGAPSTGGYGWTWTLSGLLQGNSYTVKGTVLNYSTGTSNASIAVNTSRFSGMPSTQYPFTSAHLIPNECLTPRPVVPAAPTVTPTPAKTTPKATTKSPGVSTPKVAPTAPTPAPPVPQTSEIATSPGTTSATISLPTSGATAVTVRYGTDANTLGLTANATDVSGATTTITLSELKPKTAYSYTASRTANNQTSTSALGSFTTKGYDIVGRFVDEKGKPVPDILGHIQKDEQVSDSDGTMTFENLAPGDYTLTFSYLGTTYDQKVSTTDSAGTPDSHALTSQKVINLDDLRNSAQHTQANGSSPTGIVVIGAMLVLGAMAAVAIWLIRRRQAGGYAVASNLHGDPLVASGNRPQPLESRSSDPLPSHAGQSLASMVKEAMEHDQAAKQQSDQQPQAPDGPGDNSSTPPSAPPPAMPPRQ